MPFLNWPSRCIVQIALPQSLPLLLPGTFVPGQREEETGKPYYDRLCGFGTGLGYCKKKAAAMAPRAACGGIINLIAHTCRQTLRFGEWRPNTPIHIATATATAAFPSPPATITTRATSNEQHANQPEMNGTPRAPSAAVAEWVAV